MPARSSQQDDPKIRRPPKEFADKVLELASSVGKTRQDILKATGYEGVSTFERLQKGKGSMHFAVAVKEALKGWGADTSQLPPIDDEPTSEMPAWRAEWIRLGDDLHRMATPERFEQEMDKLRRLVEAHRLVAGELAEISRPNVSTDKPRR